MKTSRKKYIILVGIMIAALIVVLLCTRPSVKPGLYVYRGAGNQEAWLELNGDGTFRFDRAIALDFMPWGTYEIKNGMCIADAGEWVYVFEIIGDNKLKLSHAQCSEAGRQSVENLIPDGAIFEYTEAAPWTLD